MNIWILNHYASGEQAQGGTRHFDLSKELVKKGHNITIFTSNFSHSSRKYTYDIKKSKFINQQGVNFIFIKTPSYTKNNIKRIFNMITYSLKSFYIGVKLKERPDVIVGSLVHPGAVISAYVLSRFYKATFYFEERDLWPQSIVDLKVLDKNSLLIKILYKLEKFFYKKAKRIIVLFEPAIEYVKSKGISEEKVLFLPNGTVLERLNNTTSAYTEHNAVFAEMKNKRIITYLGSHSKANYLSAIIKLADLMKEHSNFQFVLIGNGTEKEKLINEVKEKNLENISFLPSVKKEQIGFYLKKSYAGIITIPDLPLYKWGISPNKIYDYLGAGLPVFMLFSHKNNVIDNNNVGIVSKEIEDLANSIINLQEDEYLDMSINAKSVAENFDWSVLADKLDFILKEDVN